MQPAARTGVKAYWLAFGVLTLVGAIRIETAASAYFETADEPFHIGCGMWWMDGRYPESCIDHAPLARIAGALPLYLRGIRSPDYSMGAYFEGAAVFRSRGEYERNLALARLGLLPFFVVASLVVWVWARRLYGYPTALAAVFLFQGLPPILGHAGLVTTDMPLTACLSLALFTLTLWLDRRSVGRALLLGGTVGISVLAKHSALPFFAVAAALITTAWGVDTLRGKGWNGRAVRAWLGHVALAGLAAALVAWAGYRFSMIPLSRAAWRPHVAVSRALHVSRLLERHPSLQEDFNRALEMPFPAGNLLLGISKVAHRDGLHGRWSYLLGEVSESGWKLFFPTVLLYKTPLAFVLLAGIGLAMFRRRDSTRPVWERLAPLLGIAGVMTVAMSAPINIGVRHVLPVYPMLAIEAGAGLIGLLGAVRWRAMARAVAVLLVAWFVASSAMAHPDYLPYFNELAGGHGENVAIGSDLDWNQDLKRLMAKMREVGSDRLAIHCDGCEILILPDLPPIPGAPSDIRLLRPYQPTEGWVAVSEWSIKVRVAWERLVAGRSDGAFDWLDPYPYTRIGKSMRLYYVPPKPQTGS